MKKELQFIILMMFSLSLFAQSEGDTIIVFPVVEISNSKAAQTPGMVINKIDSVQVLINQFNSVAELLSKYSGVHIRNYGNGLLSTINYRGLGANHTSILWNGIPINSPNLGLTDLSLLPVICFDEVSVISGGTGTVHGNNSFGTAIELQNNSIKANEIILSGMAGSYESSATNYQINYNDKKFSLTTSLYKSYSKNNFEFINTTRSDNQIQKQINAKQQQTGFLQNLNYNFSDYHSIKAGIWFQFSEREIPPLMFTFRNEEVQRDSSLRIFTQWEKKFHKSALINNLSFAREYIFYNNYISGVRGASDVKNYSEEITWKFYPARKIIINFSASGEIAVANILEYRKLKKFNKIGINANGKYILSEKWIVGGGIGKEFTSLSDAPFVFSAGIEYNLIKNLLLLSTGISKIYSLPTLNDLYWNPGGNKFLKPEHGINSQFHFSYKYFKESQLNVTAFYSMINDWIQWIPDAAGIFSPVNVKEVKSSGIEVTVKQNLYYGFWKLSLSGNYSYTHTINKSFENNPELENKQLTFVPLHMSNLFVSLYYKKTGYYANAEFTGKRFTTADNSSTLDPYLLVNSGLILNYNYDRFQFIIKPEVRNIFNERYEPIPWRAMPGRSYFLIINMNLNLNKLK